MSNASHKSGMGTMAWGHGRTGALNLGEKVRLVGNLAYVGTREAVDAMRRGVGGLRPETVALTDLMPPQTALVEDSLALAQETQEQSLLYHSWRTYLFGVLLAAHERIPLDRSKFFAAAILHDTGLTASHKDSASDRCFAVSGGERVDEFLRAKGHPAADVHEVAEAITLHLNGWVPKRRHGATAHLVSRGAVCDLFGFGRRRLPVNSIIEIHHQYPREGVIDGLRYETVVHATGTRPAVMTALTGGKAPKDQFVPLLAAKN